MKLFPAALATLVLAAAAPATAQSDFLSTLLKQVVRPANSQQASSKVLPSATVTPTAAQAASLHALVTARRPNPQIAKDVVEAGPLIEKLAATGACAINATAWNSLNRDAVEPRTWRGDNDDQLTIPRFNDPYHDPRSCHDVIRIMYDGKPAANALEFRVYYVSPQSQAARNQRFVIMKTTEGPWMVKEIHGAQS